MVEANLQGLILPRAINTFRHAYAYFYFFDIMVCVPGDLIPFPIESKLLKNIKYVVFKFT